MKKAIVIGITGQDGAYLAELLLSKNYKVYGTYRRTSSVNFWRIEELNIKDHDNLELVEFDLTDALNAVQMISRIEPDEIYNVAAQSFVGVSFEQKITTTNVNALGVIHLLEAIRLVSPSIRYYQAGTSEMFGSASEGAQNEETPFRPRSPYGISKLHAHWTTINFCEAYGIFAANGILFNHESPLRGKEFVTRKITDGVARTKIGDKTPIELGNLEARRDWGYAREYVDGMWRILQAPTPDTYVLATGISYSVRDFAQMAFQMASINISFEGQGENEIARDVKTGNVVIRINPKFYRPSEIDCLTGSYKKAQLELGWSPQTSLEELCALMVEADMRRNLSGRSF